MQEQKLKAISDDGDKEKIGKAAQYTRNWLDVSCSADASGHRVFFQMGR